MGTQIFITPPGKSTDEIKVYDRCSTKLSTTDKAGSFSLILPSFDTSLFEKYVLGSDVRIIQGDNVFRGWILNPRKAKSGQKYVLQIDGMAYAGKTQKILITESYVNQTIDFIVRDLFAKYAPDYNLDSMVLCSKIITIKFSDVFLFDAMEQMAKLAGYEWYIDEPTPESIDTVSQVAGWRELVETFVFKAPIPSDTLYPSGDLYPC